MQFPIGGPLEGSLYLQPFLRYSAQHMLTNERTHTNKQNESWYLRAKATNNYDKRIKGLNKL